MRGRVLAIAGSDSSGGAGIQADVKTCTALGAYAATAITALTAQNTHGVHEILPTPPGFVAAQIACVLDDIGADAIKTGMLGNAAVVHAVADAVAGRNAPIVVDPVLVATSGQILLAVDAIDVLRNRLIARAALVTPNIQEAERLTGVRITDLDGMRRAAAALLRTGVGAVLVKGGHLAGDEVTDLLVTEQGAEAFTAPRLPGRHTHGTGCTLASAIAAGLAQGTALREAVLHARAFVRAAIAAAPGWGGGRGPLNHCV